jgi:hemerythrin-like domain-containing protein
MIQIGKSREAVSDEPLDFLVACHGRILNRLEILARVAEGIERDPSAAISALRNTIRFFDISGRLHTEDEEQSVFPRLRPRLSSEQLAYLDSLESQHREKERVYAEIKSLAAELESGITPEKAARLRSLTSRLAELYGPHIDSENDILVKIGRDTLTAEELALIREEMQARRR